MISKYPLLESLSNHPVCHQMDRFYMIDPNSIIILLPGNHPPYAFGHNYGYRLGLGHDHDILVFPEAIIELENHKIESISNAGNHVCALTKEGQVFVWGSDPFNRVIHTKPNWLSCSGIVQKVVCSFWFRIILQSDGISSIFSIYDVPCLHPICNSLDIGCTSDRYLILTKNAIISDVYHSASGLKMISYVISQWLLIKKLICGKRKILLLSTTGYVYHCEFNHIDRTILADQLLNIPEIIDGHGSIQHNTFVLVDRQQHCHVWNGDTDEMFHTEIVSISDAFMQFEILFTSNMITSFE